MAARRFGRLALAWRGALGIVVLLAATGLIVNKAVSQDKPAGAVENKPQPPKDKQPTEEAKAPTTTAAATTSEPSPEEMAAMMDRLQELSSPGENHTRLNALVGNWDVVMRSWTEDPSAPPVESKGSAQIRWVLGGRFLSEEVNGEIIMVNPETGKEEKELFQGQGLTGFDNYKNMYVSTWVDNMGTQMFISKGSCDPSGKIITYYGEMDEPILGVHGRMMRIVTRIVDQDKHIMELHDLFGGGEGKMLEMVYTRRK